MIASKSLLVAVNGSAECVQRADERAEKKAQHENTCNVVPYCSLVPSGGYLYVPAWLAAVRTCSKT
jgi:hypothetical protein